MSETRSEALQRYAIRMRIMENRKKRLPTNAMSEFLSPNKRRRRIKGVFNEEGD